MLLALKEILCNRETDSDIARGGRGCLGGVLMSCSKYDLTLSSTESLRKVRWGFNLDPTVLFSQMITTLGHKNIKLPSVAIISTNLSLARAQHL